MDHALFGLEVLSEQRVLTRISPDKRKLIHGAVRHHNLKELPEQLSTRQLLFSQLLRDADKLDIWQVIVMQQRERGHLLETLAGNLPTGTSYSHKIVATLRQGQSPDFSYVRNSNDVRLIRLGWVFDLNFAASCRQVLKRRYVEELCSELPANEEIRELEEYFISYLRNRGRVSS